MWAHQGPPRITWGSRPTFLRSPAQTLFDSINSALTFLNPISRMISEAPSAGIDFVPRNRAFRDCNS